MRVLQIHNRYLERGGEDNVYEMQKDLLAEAGHEVHYYDVTNPADAKGRVSALSRAPWNRTQAKAIQKMARDVRPDVAHVHNTWFSLSPAVLVALRKEGIPTVFEAHNYRVHCVDASFYRDNQVCTDCLGKVPWRGVARGCYHDSRPISSVVAATTTLHRMLGTWSSVDRIIAPSEWMRSIYIEAGYDDAHIDVVRNSAPDPGPRTQPPSHSDEVVCIGRMVPNKGLLELAREWHANEHRLNGIKLRFIGDGPLAPDIDALSPASISRTAWTSREEIAEILRRSRALICPSLVPDVCPLTVVEAFAAALPVVVSDRGSLPELASLGGGQVAAIGNRNAWAEALGGLMDDDYVDRAGPKSRRGFEEYLSPNVHLEGLVEAYEKARAKHDVTR